MSKCIDGHDDFLNSKPLDQTFQSIYNQAVEHCIEVVKSCSGLFEYQRDCDEMISELQKLKK